MKFNFFIDENLRILDDKNNLVFVDDLSYSYTLLSDDITKGERSCNTTPYDSRQGRLNLLKRKQKDRYVLHSEDNKTFLQISQKNEIVYFDLQTESQEYSEFGLNLPLNFMGKLNGGGYKNQYLFNSPYRSRDNKIKFCFIKNLNGNNICVLFLSDADGWKMDYSPYVGGHFFFNLKCLASFDKAYGTGSNNQKLSLAMFYVKDNYDCINKVSKLLNLPFLYYEKNYTLNGSGQLKVIGDCDYVQMISEKEVVNLQVENGTVNYNNAKYKVEFVPYFNGKSGGDCSVYAYTDIKELWKKSNECVCNYKGEWIPDINACEGQCFVESLIDYCIRFDKNKLFIDTIIRHLEDITMQTDENKAIKRATIFNKTYNNFPPYHIFNSYRIQEQFFAVSIFYKAYILFGEEKYLTYCFNSLDVIIDNYQKDNGMIVGYENQDYSTVTCPMITLVDVGLFAKDIDKTRSKKYLLSAKKLASYIYKRGYSFPTESEETDQAGEEFEDGSISCSALSLLYYCAKVEKKEKYISFAEELLEFHEKWVMESLDANVYRSSLRWWETRWEGDGDGPALCCGHGWTIWRAEADYWLYKLTLNKKSLQKSMCSFTTNFAKFNHLTGEAKSIYSVDYITGGGLKLDKKYVKYRIAPSLPDSIDVRLAYYVFNRADETIFNDVLKLY